MSHPGAVLLVAARRLAPVTIAGLVFGGCNSETDPTPACYLAPPEGTTQTALSCVSAAGSCGACGAGGASITATFTEPETFDATLRFRVRGARPNTKYIAQRDPEGGVSGNDHQCQRANGQSPYTAADGFTDPAFLTFPLSNVTPTNALTTDAAGDGSLEFQFHRSPVTGITHGLEYDAMMRSVDNEPAPTLGLRGECLRV